MTVEVAIRLGVLFMGSLGLFAAYDELNYAASLYMSGQYKKAHQAVLWMLGGVFTGGSLVIGSVVI